MKHMNHMKKIISLLLILAMCFAMFACGDGTTSSDENKVIADGELKPIEGNPYGETASIYEERISFELEYQGVVNDCEKYILTAKNCDNYRDDISFSVLYSNLDDRYIKSSLNLQNLKDGFSVMLKSELIQKAFDNRGSNCLTLLAVDKSGMPIDPITGEGYADKKSLKIAWETYKTYCERPVELEKKIEAKVSDYNDFLRAYNLRWHEYPMTEEDHIDNVCYCIATGNFAWTNSINGSLPLQNISTIKVEIAGHMLNQQHEFCLVDGRYYIALKPGVESPLSPQDISTQIVEAYNVAKEIHDDLHLSGKIAAEMNQKQIAEVYSEYMQKYGAKTPEYFMGDNFPEDYDNPSVRIKYIVDDTAYGCLVNKSGACGSKAAAYNLLMNIEGIYTIGIHTEGHIVSYLFLDGKEYMCDWGNRWGLFTAEDVNAGKVGNIKFAEGENWLENVRQFYKDFR